MAALIDWTEPPAMSPTAPSPALAAADGTLWLAYRIARDPHHCAVLRFERVTRHAWGAPPARHVEELGPGLPAGGFYEVRGGDGSPRARRWLVTFPDAILEVLAAEGLVVLRATAAPSPAHALAALLA